MTVYEFPTGSGNEFVLDASHHSGNEANIFADAVDDTASTANTWTATGGDSPLKLKITLPNDLAYPVRSVMTLADPYVTSPNQ